MNGFFKIGNGESVRFWEDVWLGETTLAQQYPSLYNIVITKQVCVAYVLAQTPINIEFRRRLDGNKWNEWLHLCQRFMTVNLTSQKDVFIWKLINDGVFTIKSMYSAIMDNSVRYHHK